ncbi:hypothetical protein SB00610_03299 [Klebsiella quasipneumoniae subsp. similipneumoniae]|nr:hypothetical protein SB00610_03299 [Klebsiella quasipneumoniae subsp. similipneumoniae]
MAKRCPASATNQSLCRIVTLAMPRWAALRNASATASGMTSTAVISQSGRSLASARAMAPVPVPRSRIRHGATGRRASACSTRHSVSGRGISVAGETNSGSDQNSRCPTRWAMGSPRWRRCRSASSVVASSAESVVSPKARIQVRARPVTCPSRISASRRGLSLSARRAIACCSQA